MNKNRLGLLILILIALGLRLTLLGQQSLWYDEGVTWMLSQMQLPALIEWTAADIQPPLYYLLIWATDIIFGDSEWALRFPSAIFSILTVPLIYTLARRLFTPASLHRYAAAPLLAAAMVTISPLMIYYSQEARMYMLLVFEATLAGYLLLKTITNYQLPITKSSFYAALYALVAAAALYTHYFAAFLLMAHAIYALYVWWQQGFAKRLLIQLLAAFGGAVLLFIPWLSILLARLGDDPSYWPGALKLNEVTRKVLITFITGETVLEQTAWLLTPIYLALLCVSIALVLRNNYVTKKPIHPSSLILHPSSLFLLLWLFIPLLLILLLTYQSPKFNPRYTLLVWPAFALLTAAVLSQLLATNRVPRPASRALRITHYAPRLIFYIFSLFTLAIAIFSLVNWFTPPPSPFVKDDFRALAQFIRERKAPDETVLLSSGHLFPVFAYYYGWEGWTPLPWMLRLDINNVTDLSIAADMAEAINGYQGAWLVTWQDEVIDPNGVVPFWLDVIGERPVDAGDFWGIGLEHWRIDVDKITLLHQNPIDRPAVYTPSSQNPETEPDSDGAYNFANQIDLLGVTQLSDTDLALFWRARQPLPDDLLMTLSLTDADGFTWSKKQVIGRPGAYFYPPSRWPVGEVVMTRHQLPWQTGTPPGLYVAEIGLGTPSENDQFNGWDVLDEQGRPQRRTALIDFVNVSRLVAPESGPLPMAKNPAVDIFPLIGLRRSILPQKSAQPGDRILLALLWQAGDYNVDDISVAFDVVDAHGQTHRVGSSFTPSRQFNLPRWKPGDVVLGQYWLDIPPEAAPGPADLQLHIINVTGYPYDEVYPFDQIEILPTERHFIPPASVDIPLEANFADVISLIGLDCPNDCTAAPGESITLTLYWRALASPEQNYTIFTHLLDTNENVLTNADHPPPKPTQGWVSDEIITDAVTLSIPPELPAGSYPVEIGLYDAAAPDLQRLPLTTGQNRVLLPQMLTIK